ncbi:type III PLP-dependent enzyme [Nocardia sp. XZ_19_369]|uniref:type III PLP-dependent enzyme n=1 Tax=Nocardia sp. XZ_19_369 TaxID=2769487 RepID=UPI0027D28743|nr:type III PLP-dependent enzyme [Nocardia sp. XZ_19_369]
MTGSAYPDLIREYGSPLYVYDLGRIRSACAALRTILPEGSRLYYSLKANPHPDIVGCLLEQGCDVEVSSEGEIDAAHAAGARSAQVLFTGPGKTRSAISHAIRTGVRRFSIESAADLDRVATESLANSTEAECLIRVNRDTRLTGSSLTMAGVSSQFGVDASALLAHRELYRSRPGAKVVGFHLFSGSNITAEDRLADQLYDNALLAAELAAAIGVELLEVDLGGGFPAPYAGRGESMNLALLKGLGDRIAAVWSGCDVPPQISFESGRYLVATSGSLLSRVVDSKVSKGQFYVVLESGVNHLGGMSGLRRLARPNPAVEILGQHDGLVRGSLVGPLCTPIDCLSSDVELPSVAEGAVVRIPDVGAYGLTASLIAFLGHPAPIEIVIDGADVVSTSKLTITREPAARISRGALHE